MPVKFRLAAVTFAVALMGALIVLAIILSHQKAEELRLQLNTVDSESQGISEHFKDSMREVNNILFRCLADHKPEDWREFLRAGSDLNSWLNQQAAKLNSSSEKQTLRDVQDAYSNYLEVAQQVYQRRQTNGQPADILAEFSRTRQNSQRLFDLGQGLARTHYESRNQLLARANVSLTQLRRWILALLALLFVSGLALAVTAYRDLIRPLQLKLVESQSLVERNEKLASLGMLAAGVAHEIRNPLTAIKAAMYIQQKKFPSGSVEAADAELVQREIQRLERIVTEFLQFARPAEPVLATVAADQPLREVQGFLSPELARRNIRLMVEESAAVPVKIDGEQMKQVLINLVRNAADSIGHDGTITLRSRAETKTLARGETEVVILEVADTGEGIPADVQKRLFDPFFTTKPDGTGLGLSIAACIVQKHGGALQYQTQVHRGTTFGIILPRAAA